ncbi:hypothetical protein ACFQZE_19550 [Paenibacillus sp. GCM10027627]|uniref:hypothetical protein n=1 Tax=unclassified Paenibacillus TaxID=185978 RepID=UPI0036435E5D
MKKKFVLASEVVTAYLVPAVMAGAGGLLTGNEELQLGAVTTIGGASAFTALALGLWLRGKERKRGWLIRAPRLVVVFILALAGALTGFVGALAGAELVGAIDAAGRWNWLAERMRFDFPLSGAIAGTIMAWRWHRYATATIFYNGGVQK